jgi:hypothetical protein
MRILLLLLLPLSIFAYKKSSHPVETACQPACMPSGAEAANCLFSSSDQGLHWLDNSRGLPADLEINEVLHNNGETFVTAGNNLLYHSTDLRSGIWELEYVGNAFGDAGGVVSGRFITGIFNCPSGIYATLSEEGGLFRRIPGTNQWQPIDENLPEKVIIDLAETSNGTLVAAGREGIFTSNDAGVHWTQVLKTPFASSLLADGPLVLCYGPAGIFRSDDAGQHWTLVLADNKRGYRLVQDGGQYLAISLGGTPRGHLLLSTDKGLHWSALEDIQWPGGACKQPATAGNPRSADDINDMTVHGGVWYISNQSGISRSDDQGKNWQLVCPFSAEKENQTLRLTRSGQLLIAARSRAGC